MAMVKVSLLSADDDESVFYHKDCRAEIVDGVVIVRNFIGMHGSVEAMYPLPSVRYVHHFD